MTININIQRASDWDTSYDIWYKLGSSPTEVGDGSFLGNYPIDPDETELIVAWDEPIAGATYGVLVLPIQRRSPGIPGTFLP